MARLINPQGKPYQLIVAYERKKDESPVGFLDDADAFTFLRGLTDDDFNRNAIRRFAVEYGLFADTRPVDETRMLRVLAAGVQSGRLLIVRPGDWHAAPTSGAGKHEPKGEPTPPPEPEPPPPTDEKTWIKFEILDEKSGKPVPGVTLKVKLPNGESRNVTSNAAGVIEITDIPPGTCEIERMTDNQTFEVVSIQ